MTAATKRRPWLAARPRCQWCGHHEATHTFTRTPSVVGVCHGCTCAQYEAAPSFEQAQLEEQAQRSVRVWLVRYTRPLKAMDAKFGQWWRVVDSNEVVHLAVGITTVGNALCGRLWGVVFSDACSPGTPLWRGEAMCPGCVRIAGGGS